MECSERVLCGTGEMELDPNIVSEEAGKLYSELQVKQFLRLHFLCMTFSFSEQNLPCFSKWDHFLDVVKHTVHGFSLLPFLLQTVIETHGESVVESLVPIFVWVLEGLASCKAQLRDKEEEAEREKVEREELLERYQAERTLRKESQEVGNDAVLMQCGVP